MSFHERRLEIWLDTDTLGIVRLTIKAREPDRYEPYYRFRTLIEGERYNTEHAALERVKDFLALEVVA